MTLLAAFFALLHRYSHQADICVGSGIANRRWPETENLIGMVLNNVVLRADMSENPRFVDFLRQVRELILSAAAHQDVPFDHVVRALQTERDMSRNPLFQVMFSFHDSPMPELDLPGLKIDLTEVLSNGSSKFDLNVIVIPRLERCSHHSTQADDRITLIWEYNSDLYNSSTIAGMIGHYQTLLEGIVADPAQRISALPLLTELEQRQIFVEWNDTQKNYPRHSCVHELFEVCVKRTPDAVAVVYEDAQLTYRELNARANQLAHHLRRFGVGPEILVGICMERSLEMVVAMLGVLKAGGAYLPLDPAYPKERLAFMIWDTQSQILLTQERLLKNLSGAEGSKFNRNLPFFVHSAEPQAPASNAHGLSFKNQFKTVCIDSGWESIARESEANPPSGASANNLAYVMYTSGSTGAPKGIGVTHRNVTRLVKESNYAELTENEVFLQFAPLSFDASTFEIWGCLLNGAKLVIAPTQVLAPDDLAKVIRISRITTLWLTSVLFHLMVDNHLAALRGVKQLLAGGDVLSVFHVKRFLGELPGCRLTNGYGPTENTTFSCCYQMTSAQQVGEVVSIGRPINNSQVYVLDDHLNPLPASVPGELYIGGDGLARGYLAWPDLTAEKFLPNPFSQEAGARLYKTGDLARYLPDGNLEFLGRIDNQVKIRGFRVELGEIESVLSQNPSVREIVVTAREDVSGGKRLVGYMVPNPGCSSTVNELKSFLKEKLPEYMVPSAFVFLDTLPLTPNGKIDRKALPTPDQSRPELEQSFVAPRNPVEEVIAEVWAEVLKVEKVGIHDNFFDLGGHSLLATQVMSRLREGLGVDLPLRALFEAPTIAELALRVGRGEAGGEEFEELARHVAEVESLSEEEIARQLVEENE